MNLRRLNLRPYSNKADPEQLPVSASRHSWKYHFLKNAHKPQNLFKTQASVKSPPRPPLLHLPQVLTRHNQQDWGHSRHETGPNGSAGHLNWVFWYTQRHNWNHLNSAWLCRDPAQHRVGEGLRTSLLHCVAISNVSWGSNSESKYNRTGEISPPICHRLSSCDLKRKEYKRKRTISDLNALQWCGASEFSSADAWWGEVWRFYPRWSKVLRALGQSALWLVGPGAPSITLLSLDKLWLHLFRNDWEQAFLGSPMILSNNTCTNIFVAALLDIWGYLAPGSYCHPPTYWGPKSETGQLQIHL